MRLPNAFQVATRHVNDKFGGVQFSISQVSAIKYAICQAEYDK